MTATSGDRRKTSRARDPDAGGVIDRGGVRIAWERYGDGDRAVMLLPTWEIADSRVWKCQIPFLARSFTVLTFDPRGNGRSDQPTETRAYDRAARVLDARAVLDAAGVGRVTLVCWCGAEDQLAFAIDYPERTDALVLIAPDLLVTESPNEWLYDTIPDWSRFLEAFYAKVFTEPHSTKSLEDGIDWGSTTNPETILRGLDAAWNNGDHPARALLAQVRCPTLVLQGTEDQIAGPRRGPAVAAALDDSQLIEFGGSGHGPQLRDPVRFNLLLRGLTGGTEPSSGRWTRAQTRSRRALYVSSPIGLGHVRRDLAIAGELRRLHPDLEIDWLAQHPVTAVLEQRGEQIHPLSAELASESAHMQSESTGHDLHCFQALRRMDEILLANFMVFLDVVQSEQYDLWIGDEAWEVDYYLHENPELKSAAYVFLTDFVGYLPMPDGGDHEAFLTADYNAEMIEQIARYPRIRDRAIFVGDPDDIVPDRFGADLPLIRDWTEQHYSFSGYITGIDPAPMSELAARRREAGYEPDEKVCIATVGGSGVGGDLLRRVIDSFPAAQRLVPDLRMIVVAGPRIDPESLPCPPGLEIRPYVHDLHRHLAACDLALIQGGLTTAMELTAYHRPFIYFPLGHHFEQNFHVHHRLERYRAGVRMDYDNATPETIAATISDQIGREVDYRRVATDGAARAASMIADLL